MDELGLRPSIKPLRGSPVSPNISNTWIFITYKKNKKNHQKNWFSFIFSHRNPYKPFCWPSCKQFWILNFLSFSTRFTFSLITFEPLLRLIWNLKENITLEILLRSMYHLSIVLVPFSGGDSGYTNRQTEVAYFINIWKN